MEKRRIIAGIFMLISIIGIIQMPFFGKFGNLVYKIQVVFLGFARVIIPLVLGCILTGHSLGILLKVVIPSTLFLGVLGVNLGIVGNFVINILINIFNKSGLIIFIVIYIIVLLLPKIKVQKIKKNPNENYTNLLNNLGLNIKVTEIKKGLSLDIIRLKIEKDETFANIKNKERDIAIAFKNKNLKINFDDKGVFLELPKRNNKVINFTDFYNNNYNLFANNGLNVPIGLNQNGSLEMLNLSKAPHLLVAGTTGSGKSVFLNNLICSLILKNNPHFLKLF